MTCPPHDYKERPPRTNDRGTYTETVFLKGKACLKCGTTLGPDKGALRVELRQKTSPAGLVPDWLVTELLQGAWSPRFPRSRDVLHDVQGLVQQGIVDVDLKAHPKTGALVVARVVAPQADATNEITRLRRTILDAAPEADEWIKRATLRDLGVAERIVVTPNYRDFAWPTRVWNAAFRDHSKQGDAARIAEALGGTVRNRASSHGIWFYGNGVIETPERQLAVEGELVVPETWLRGDVRLRGVETIGILENRDVASLAPSFSMALDGHLTPTQKHVIHEIANQGIPAWVWADTDGAGITITRAVRCLYPAIRIVGMHHWPKEWSIGTTPEQRNQALDAASFDDDLTHVANHVLCVGRFEQERIFAEAAMRRVEWPQILQDNTWVANATPTDRAPSVGPAFRKSSEEVQ